MHLLKICIKDIEGNWKKLWLEVQHNILVNFQTIRGPSEDTRIGPYEGTRIIDS